MTITGVSSIAENTTSVPYPQAFAGAAPAKDASTPVQPGTAEIDITVTIVYLIG